jgi:hypothetical protein
MDPARFDRLVQDLTHSGTRRRALGLLLVSALAPATAAAKPEPAKCLPAGKRCALHDAQSDRHGKRKDKGKHRSPSCTKCCSRFGSVGADGKAHCAFKPDGESCDNPSQCCGGMCRDGQCTVCPSNLTACSGQCVDLQTNNQHCGDCATACATGQRCQHGQCVCDGQSCPNGCCADRQTCQRGTNEQACGVNGAACQTCTSGERCDGTACVCVPDRCATPCCGAHCCAEGQICLTDGTCAPACNPDDPFCGSGATCDCKPVLNGSGNACLDRNICSCAADCAECQVGSICVASVLMICPTDQPRFCCAPCAS